ncbi:MAG: DUF1588 domain-containing protein [Pirellulaceae bacterium]|nr:DUF1588 domain-containing protein [Pirellulaceae bacterium]
MTTTRMRSASASLLLNLSLVLPLVALSSRFAFAEEASEASPVPAEVRAVIAKRCVDCHGADASEGGVRLDQLDSLSLAARLDLLNRAQDQLFFRLMPPADAEQPESGERAVLAGWIGQTLRQHGASKLDEKLRYPDYGNYVDHQQLFSGEVQQPAFTPARRWLVSPQIFHERVMDVFQLTGRDRDNFESRSFFGVTNPFLLPDQAGVRYYDNSAIDGGHLLVMLNNAQWISRKQLQAALLKTSGPQNGATENPADRWFPKTTPPAFEAIVLSDAPPTDAQLVAAIQTQFGLVLRREATSSEVEKYVALTRQAVGLGGNAEGLRQMLVAVLLESEFLYRLEFGAGEPDEFGRRRLSPREASEAISYALGDRAPDPELVRAAAEGRLQTKDDVRREVERLLKESEYYRGQVDPSLNGMHYQSNQTSHPRLVRFFREFFGYPGSIKVFKDPPRSEGYYANPDRGTLGTPGYLTLEADRIVTLHVEKDEQVFERLLTTDEFFVYHDRDNETGRKIIEEWREVYQRLKGTAWKTDPAQVMAENLEFLKARKATRIVEKSPPGELVNLMYYLEESLGQGRTPFTTVPWAHGYKYHHAPFYGLPPTPSIGRYGDWRTTNYTRKLEPKVFWDYPTEQPFRIAQRKGILTHPAWLIAYSSNFHTDPVRRGRWIREKLLAGRVPDVPITVDAVVPENPHQTFRQRVESATGSQQCWKCHQHMNPLGMAFEMYDDFGRNRQLEPLEHPDNLLQRGDGKTTFDRYKTAPVVTTGALSGTGEASLDGEVADALDLIDRLAKSERVRQSIIRHAFRFFLGRNETLADSQTLIEADRAYVESGGSFRAVVVSLLTSDSFLYRQDLGNRS